jgi:hypothetical protein
VGLGDPARMEVVRLGRMPLGGGIAQQRAEWKSSKAKRAAGCNNLNFTHLIHTSARHGNERPSRKVRGATISVIVASVFEDLCPRKESMDSTVNEIAYLLDRLKHVALLAHIPSLDEVIGKVVDEAYGEQLRTVFDHLGSLHSVIAFHGALCDMRRSDSVDNIVLSGARSAGENLRIINGLWESSAADSLLTICHTVRLFKDNRDGLVDVQGHFLMQTQMSFSEWRGKLSGDSLSLAWWCCRWHGCHGESKEEVQSNSRYDIEKVYENII